MDKRKVIVTGAGGQLGRDLVSLLNEEEYETFGLTRSELDFSKREEVDRIVSLLKPDIIIHSGAYTKVDQAESEPDVAHQVNGDGAGYIAAAAERIGAKLVYVSSDYVFDGSASQPIPESAATHPINVYGASKRKGEEQSQALCSRCFIVRTSWVYGIHGANFVKTMLNLARQGKPLSVVQDQVGSPTFTRDLAACMLGLMDTERYGIYHVSNSGFCSWYEFAQAIFEEAGLEVELAPVSSDQFVRPARRPAYSVLGHEALREHGFPEMRHWRDGLKEFVRMGSAIKQLQ
ncbi:dTDP-4-dehydrorhamnose reductase [Paenibacillus albicereus]|uniref:dTDP-4-dehydrorhamnose reductase n=1 Tax=Paenibacillus albicereus TaxID=2726185 RepID=A0A6H2GUN3_9BACL|nr:dTDP-4-dehydrorhamnose reductase [Paenibacillus albicereus]QJC51134.1 dTDP-4-dehydrorhamnose reductase [Paenibacillus albicereus]